MHTTFEDGVEMVEEYDISKDDLVSRKWKSPNIVSGKGDVWEYE